MTRSKQTAAAPRCPRCGGYIPNDLEAGAYPGALSRLDGKTEICSSCGQDEALWNFTQPGASLPPLDQPAAYWTRHNG